MIRLNVHETLKKAAIERAKPKPLPKIFIVKKAENSKPKPLPSPVANNQIDKPNLIIKADVAELNTALKATLVDSLELEYNRVMTERKKLSSQIWKLVENGASREELAEHYQKIEDFRPQLQKLYDDIEYAKRYGQLPAEPVTAQEDETIYSLKLKRKALIDKRCKLKAKIAKKASQKAAKYVEWELELEMADAEYTHIDTKIKVMEGKA